MDLAALSQALRAAVSLRDQVVVVRLDPAALETPEHLEGIARSLALLRALDLRVIVVSAIRAQAPQLVAAISRHGQRALAVLTAGVITVHKLMVPAPDAGAPGSAAMVPMYIPVVDQALLVQLCSLRYIPLLMLPVVDEAGQPIDLSDDEVGAAVGKFLEARLVVFLHGAGSAPAAPPAADGRPTMVLSAAEPEKLFAELLLGK
jgi:acetylglutamate kinase